jgi:hypothetical protein
VAVGTGTHVTCLGKSSRADLSRGISPDLRYHLRLCHQEMYVEHVSFFCLFFGFHNYL